MCWIPLLGCVGGLAIQVRRPYLSETPNPVQYANREGYYSVNMQAICDANLFFCVATWESNTNSSSGMSFNNNTLLLSCSWFHFASFSTPALFFSHIALPVANLQLMHSNLVWSKFNISSSSFVVIWRWAAEESGENTSFITDAQLLSCCTCCNSVKEGQQEHHREHACYAYTPHICAGHLQSVCA